MSFGTSGVSQLNAVGGLNGDVKPTAVVSTSEVAVPDPSADYVTNEHHVGANGDQPNGDVHVADGEQASKKELVDEAIKKASANALRLALFSETGDQGLSTMKVSKQLIRGGAMMDYVLSEEDTVTVRAKAREYLLKPKGSSNIKDERRPSKQEAKKLMETFAGHSLSQAEINLGYEELAFDDFPRELHWQEGKRPSAERLSSYKVAVIGAGISGVSTAVHLKRLGIPFVGIDRQDGIGGTWLQNTYPEARVDTLGFLFQYKFVRGYRWKEHFPAGGSLLEYLRYVAREFNVEEDFMFGREVIAATWNEYRSTWILQLQHKGGMQKLEVNAIVSATGLFNKPCLPEIPGISSYEGQMCHTTQWNHAYQWKGMRIAVIGNGSSGAQLMPALARHASSLALYQRTPQWIAGFDGYRDAIPEATHWLMENMPYYQNWLGYTCFMRGMQLPPIQIRDKAWQAKGGLVNERNDAMRKGLTEYIKTKVKGDPVLIKKLTPTFAPLVRRLVVDNGFYDALLQENVELVTDPIETFTADGILTKDGTKRTFDLIVLACGFKPTEYLWPIKFTGRDNVTLEQTWSKDGARSYLGLTIPGYPNLYCLYGPNHQPRGGPSIHSFAEIWARYAIQSIMYMLENGLRSMAVRDSVYEEYNKKLDEAVSELIWEEQGRGYFVNSFGRQAVNMPWTSDTYHAMVSRINVEDFYVR